MSLHIICRGGNIGNTSKMKRQIIRKEHSSVRFFPSFLNDGFYAITGLSLLGIEATQTEQGRNGKSNAGIA